MMGIDASRMPVLFVGHGSPMNAIERNAFHLRWGDLGRELPRPKAILCVSAHWETEGVCLTSAERPETIHDFYGFPQALFDVRYPAKGDPALAQRTVDLLAGEQARLDPEWGLDHGSWSILVAMYPKADVPVVQLSLDTRQPGSFHYHLAKRLAPLRDEGILILASGNIVHNLRTFSFRDPTPPTWATAFDADVKRRIEARDHEALMAYPTLDHAALAIPTPEHYLPLLYALALHDKSDTLSFFNESVVSTIAMTSVLLRPEA